VHDKTKSLMREIRRRRRDAYETCQVSIQAVFGVSVVSGKPSETGIETSHTRGPKN